MATTLPVASWADTGRALRDVLMPLVAQGAILRRSRTLGLLERVQADSRSLRRVRRLRDRYGDGPLLLRIPRRSVALVLHPDDVRRILLQTPQPFSVATSEKVAALRHFEPHGVLVSDPPLRAARRQVNDEALDSDRPVHRHGAAMVKVVTEELAALGDATGEVRWRQFREIWLRITRRVVLGDSARDDTAVSDLLDSLRSDANWAQFHRRREARRKQLEDRIGGYVDKGEDGSLVSQLKSWPNDEVDPAGQVPQWLFAFDAAGIALWRLLAVLAARPEFAAPVLDEARHQAESPLLARAGAAIQESIRLWPTTLVILRQSTTLTDWRGLTAPAGTELAIVSSVFHRDAQALPYANKFEPEVWLDGRSDGSWPLIPFSAGPGVCPGRNVVLLITSAATDQLLDTFELEADRATARKLAGDMPATFDHSAARLVFRRRE
jgi:cytochrome P450